MERELEREPAREPALEPAQASALLLGARAARAARVRRARGPLRENLEQGLRPPEPVVQEMMPPPMEMEYGDQYGNDSRTSLAYDEREYQA